MILVDANVLLYAHAEDSPQHVRAKRWLETALETEPDVRIALPTVLAFLRIGTDPRIFVQPLSSSGAIAIVESWLERSNVSLALPTESHWKTLDRLATAGKAKGALLMDAHLAALAIEHGAVLASGDRDFARFKDLKVIDPLMA